MKKILLIMVLILMFTSSVFTAGNDGMDTGGLKFGEDYISIYFTCYDYIVGIGFANVGDDVPSYNDVIKNELPIDSIDGGKYAGGETEVYFGRIFNYSEKINIIASGGFATHTQTKLYYSQNEDSYYKKDITIKSKFTFQLGTEYSVTDRFKIDLGYHNEYGLIGGIRYDF